MQKKKLTALLLTLALCLSMAACGGPSPSADGGDPATPAPVVIDAVDTYAAIPSSRDASVEIPIGVTVPAHAEGKTCPVAVLVHGFLGSKDEEFGFFANGTDETYPYESMADQLLSLGIGTIRIDQPGSGESGDDFRNYTLDNCVSDVQDAYDYCMETYDFDANRAAMIGWSMGGKVGPKFVSQNSNISTMVLLNPAADNGATSLLTAAGAALDWETLNAAAQANGEVFNETASGFVGRELTMSKAFFDQVNSSKTGDELTAFIQNGGHGLMIYGDQDSVINPVTYQWVIEHSGMAYLCVPGMDHDLGLESDRPDYTRIVLDAAVSYTYRYLTAA
ncbi:alpha/beta fold hydrolase [Agathobaculum sp. NTUH-O15-33]|uniref:alpha/beta hydrolase family protein n=1 Tax=Agathobaculum sp. NTUH-O15-33 TaxID=3079302 RepID=UPI0029589B35|nr:alpha/beta fold hydrolase [Agathobaculum sp. NTUH-O15-33]WNX85151.1 alpha/beta fold hydrolase [Agathobaculum sp. NTUH-O15-33]